jgi:hypothetical protein
MARSLSAANLLAGAFRQITGVVLHVYRHPLTRVG